MAEGKWISDLTATTPLVDAARRVLAIRLEVVRDYLGLALREADQDPEYIHQLRVSTRRGGAAIEIFASCLPDKVYALTRKQLRRIRRAAGMARDWDVFLAALSVEKEKKKHRHRPALDFLSGHALGQRIGAQAELETVAADYPYGFDRLLAETLGGIHKPHYDVGIRTLLDLAGPLLLGLLRDFNHAASAELVDYAELHRVRIMGKRLRYAMEIFADCFEAPFREQLYPAVEEMQEILGRANDSHVAIQRLSLLREKVRVLLPDDCKRLKPGLDALVKHHEHQMPKEKQQFLEWRERWQAAGAELSLATLRRRPEPAFSK